MKLSLPNPTHSPSTLCPNFCLTSILASTCTGSSARNKPGSLTLSGFPLKSSHVCDASRASACVLVMDAVTEHECPVSTRMSVALSYVKRSPDWSMRMLTPARRVPARWVTTAQSARTVASPREQSRKPMAGLRSWERTRSGLEGRTAMRLAEARVVKGRRVEGRILVMVGVLGGLGVVVVGVEGRRGCGMGCWGGKGGGLNM